MERPHYEIVESDNFALTRDELELHNPEVEEFLALALWALSRDPFEAGLIAYVEAETEVWFLPMESFADDGLDGIGLYYSIHEHQVHLLAIANPNLGRGAGEWTDGAE